MLRHARQIGGHFQAPQTMKVVEGEEVASLMYGEQEYSVGFELDKDALVILCDW
jgi:hypothetical protein